MQYFACPICNVEIMKKKNLISLFVAGIFLTLGISGLLMYFAFRDPGVKTTHILFGLLFITIAIFHIINNWSSLVGYTKPRSERKIQKEFWVAGGIVGLIVLGTALNFEPLAELAHFGEELGRGERARVKRLVFEEITTNELVNGMALDILLQKSPAAALPVVAIWVEDTTGDFRQNLFVPAKQIKLLEEGEDVRHILEEGEFEYENLNPATLATWSAKSNAKASTYPQATPTEHFLLHTHTSVTSPFSVLLEINNAGKSEVYRALIDTEKGEAFKFTGVDGTLLASGLVMVQ